MVSISCFYLTFQTNGTPTPSSYVFKLFGVLLNISSVQNLKKAADQFLAITSSQDMCRYIFLFRVNIWMIKWTVYREKPTVRKLQDDVFLW